MSDKMRWRYGDTNPVVAQPVADCEIQIGDMVYQQANDLTASLVDVEVIETLEPQFLGIAMQRSSKGETTPIRVATTGVFEFDIADSKLPQRLGQLIQPLTPFSDNQKVEHTTMFKWTIGRIAKRNPTGAETVLVDIRSQVMTGGVLPNFPKIVQLAKL